MWSRSVPIAVCYSNDAWCGVVRSVVWVVGWLALCLLMSCDAWLVVITLDTITVVSSCLV